MTEVTPRLGFPLLACGQAQKEITHNEALTLADILVQAIVQAVAPAAIPPSPQPGQCWIVGTGAAGAWAGRDNAIACWTENGWRFTPSQPGMRVWSHEVSVLGNVGGVQVVGSRQPAIPDVTGGNAADAEVRVAVGAILHVLRTHGLIEA